MCLPLSDNYITVLLWCHFNDINTVVGPTPVDTVPQDLKSNGMKLRGAINPSHIV